MTKYRVTATDGLNVRTIPSAIGAKMVKPITFQVPARAAHVAKV